MANSLAEMRCISISLVAIFSRFQFMFIAAVDLSWLRSTDLTTFYTHSALNRLFPQSLKKKKKSDFLRKSYKYGNKIEKCIQKYNGLPKSRKSTKNQEDNFA